MHRTALLLLVPLLLVPLLLACAPSEAPTPVGSALRDSPAGPAAEHAERMPRSRVPSLHTLSPPRTGVAPIPVDVLLRRVSIPGFGEADVGILGQDIAVVEAAGKGAFNADEIHDLQGRWLVPAFIDSHVHLVYLNEAKALAEGGIAAAVDHAAPLSFFEDDFTPLEVRGSGPMITPVGGYPTQSWGANGYGRESTGASEAVAAVHDLVAHGASLIKVALGHGPTFPPDVLAAIAEAAHSHGLPVSAHAVTDAEAHLARSLGADILAHTPVERLSDLSVAAWSEGTVISTLAAFGGSSETIINLSHLRDAGTRILYGTDFGNATWPGIHPGELAHMLEAGMSGGEILASGTSVPASFWKFPRHGNIGPGRAASLLVLSEDPLSDPLTLAAPAGVLNEGKWLGTGGPGDEWGR